MKILINKICQTCKKNYQVWPYNKKSKYCSHPCYAKSLDLSGSKNPAWKGGRIKHGNGYWMISVGNKKHKLEHRLVMEKYLGRKLKKQEKIHHLNGIKTDNRLENLQLMSQSEHASLHTKFRKRNKKGIFI